MIRTKKHRPSQLQLVVTLTVALLLGLYVATLQFAYEEFAASLKPTQKFFAALYFVLVLYSGSAAWDITKRVLRLSEKDFSDFLSHVVEFFVFLFTAIVLCMLAVYGIFMPNWIRFLFFVPGVIVYFIGVFALLRSFALVVRSEPA